MTIEFQVEGMSCQHCVAAVTNAIREQDGAAQVKVDLATGRVAVESAQPADRLKAAIDEAGYTVVETH
ncbi:MAG: cation transporter [Paraburkholderia sp.]|jgi:copper chaperone|uniref:heavy-metal-associated domain-containing protein n=1 Tax=Burkholderiaceae TaxID=119060 RepID=UPI0010F98BBF|nr:cation transporter [Burkholderia sp. 4M9327F10]